MESAKFWALLEQSRRGFSRHEPDGNMDRQRAQLTSLLEGLSVQDLLSFRELLWSSVREAYSEDLWYAAYLVGRGCSSDAFDDFRAWLISMGEAVYRSALHDPDSLAGPASEPDVEDIFFEGLLWLPDEIYEERTGKSAPRIARNEPLSRPQVDEATLPARFPALWSKFRNR